MISRGTITESFGLGNSVRNLLSNSFASEYPCGVSKSALPNSSVNSEMLILRGDTVVSSVMFACSSGFLNTTFLFSTTAFAFLFTFVFSALFFFSIFICCCSFAICCSTVCGVSLDLIGFIGKEGTAFGVSFTLPNVSSMFILTSSS